MAITCKGFLFDLDGTLVDSLPVVEHCWALFGERVGVSTQEINDYIHGKPAIESIRHFMPNATEQEITETFRWLEKLESTQTEGLAPLPGAIELINHLNDLNIPWAIVTSGTVPIASTRQSVTGIPEPKHWVTAECISKGKPDPEPYLLGAKKLGLLPQDCVVFEDAAAGIYSGLDAGCQVVAVHAPLSLPRRNEIHLIIDSLNDIQIEKQAEKVIITHKR
ncbi:sugar phosphatase [Proteus appendicitidis]|uniref:Sugar phosphatase n=1 Tax=Proteus appendicitidis TaxID=3034648 RepID=A0ABY8Y4H7_9GAMM|nr:sugar phosphatase [Proteus sp. HZ0627]WIV87295.1 sugar phosphatase [Proteus sp. HZ0627]